MVASKERVRGYVCEFVAVDRASCLMCWIWLGMVNMVGRLAGEEARVCLRILI